MNSNLYPRAQVDAYNAALRASQAKERVAKMAADELPNCFEAECRPNRHNGCSLIATEAAERAKIEASHQALRTLTATPEHQAWSKHLLANSGGLMDCGDHDR